MHALEILALVGLVLLVFAATMRFAKGGDRFLFMTFNFFPRMKLQAWVRRSFVVGILLVAPWYFSLVHGFGEAIVGIVLFVLCLYALFVFIVPIVIFILLVAYDILHGIWKWMS
jgi:hypothetical protein